MWFVNVKLGRRDRVRRGQDCDRLRILEVRGEVVMKRGGVFYPEVCWSSTEDAVGKR